MSELHLMPIVEEYGWTINWYYSPERYDLETVHSVDLAGDYSFHIYVVLKDREGNNWWAHDSGCSCPSPFGENWTLFSLDDYHSWMEFKKLVLTASENSSNDGAIVRAAEFISKLERILPGAAWERLRELSDESTP